MAHLYSHKLKHIDGIDFPVAVLVNHFFHISQVNQALGTSGTGKVGDKNKLLCFPGGITVNHGIFFRMKTAAISGFLPVTGILQAGGVTVVSDCDYLYLISSRDHCANTQSLTRGSPGNRFSKLNVNFFKGWTVFYHSDSLTAAPYGFFRA